MSRPIFLIAFRSLLAGIGTGLVFLAPAFSQHPTPRRARQGPTFDTAVVNRGRTTFKSNCGFCHGEDARGNRAPDLVRSALLGHDDGGNLIGPVIRNGRPDKGMPGFASLKDSDVTDIVTFLHYSAQEALHSGHVADDYPLAKLLTGNPQAGKAYFEGKGGCARCHSVTGDLAGISKKYSPIDLQQHMVYPSRSLPVTATVTTADGKRYEGKVEHDDEFTIAISGPDGWYRSWSKDQVKVELHDPLAAHRELTEAYTDQDIHNLFAYLESLR